MPRRPLGRTGLEVGLLGLGTVKLGRTTGLKYPRPFRVPTEDEAAGLLDTAADLGINLIDTAPAYGTAEERLGSLLRGRRPPRAPGAASRRDRWVICSKAGEEHDERGSRYDFTPEAVRRSCERSLGRLRTDRLDVLLIHSDGRGELELDRLGTLDLLDELKAEGKARAVGVSVKTTAGARLAIARADVVMLTINRHDPEAVPLAAEAEAAGVGVLVKKALASGHADPADGLRFAASRAGVSSIVVGTVNPRHLAANAAAVVEP